MLGSPAQSCGTPPGSQGSVGGSDRGARVRPTDVAPCTLDISSIASGSRRHRLWRCEIRSTAEREGSAQVRGQAHRGTCLMDDIDAEGASEGAESERGVVGDGEHGVRIGLPTLADAVRGPRT